ncbi:metallophosphoesterase 1 isoform X1 [Osmia bicornis bicornis]|uniref:metallophosphoesterase 1 isoform X1 n=1 Tax=Osmia bicornis bicornis TaxID=1437191 RepID=UPI0010F47FAB|nr:metallophosphoesterase 1 isoform X1 [Osmia bicornis bicornis]
MLGTRTFSYKKYLAEAGIALVCVFIFCEYLVYYCVLIQCAWPMLDPHKVDVTITPTKSDEIPVHAMFLADTHLLGSKNGHWFDKLKREWQMYRAFQTMVTIHKPDIIFILGDLFDEGQWSSSTEFYQYIERFHSLFSVPKNTYLYVVAGNHDIGFHYAITPYLNQRFVNGLKSPSVKRISIRGNHFVLINSMALEGDGCFLCRPTEIALNKIAAHLKCAKGVGNNCDNDNTISRYSRPIILQHYPMYRESDEVCNELDEAPEEVKSIKFRERWECLSKEASEQLLDILNPRLIINGHTHHGCRRMHRQDTMEFTIPSFSWRNKDNPSLLLGVFTPNNYSVSKCYMPMESTEIKIYIISIVYLFIYFIIKCKIRQSRYYFLKFH